MKESVMTNMTQVKQIIDEDDDISNFEISTRAEVHYTGKENIEGFASLVNIFLRSMLMTSKHPCLINVDNVDHNQLSQLKMEDGQIFYHSTLEFKDTFTTLLATKVKNLKTINVRTSFALMPDREISVKVANRLCGNAFSYVGLRNTLQFDCK